VESGRPPLLVDEIKAIAEQSPNEAPALDAGIVAASKPPKGIAVGLNVGQKYLTLSE